MLCFFLHCKATGQTQSQCSVGVFLFFEFGSLFYDIPESDVSHDIDGSLLIFGRLLYRSRCYKCELEVHWLLLISILCASRLLTFLKIIACVSNTICTAVFILT